MTKAKGILAVTVLFGLTALTGLAQKAPNLTGTWVGKTDIPVTGTIEMTLVLKRAETSYGGTISIDHNETEIQASTEIRDVTTDGERFSFVFPLGDTNGSLILVKLVVVDDKMTGRWEHPSGSTGAVEFVKRP